MSVGKCVVASLGFDVDFVLRRLRSGDVERLVCFGIKVDEQGWFRVEKAFSLIKHYCEAVRLPCALESVSPGSIVSEVRSVLERELKECMGLELFLTGGPRVSVVGGLLAALSLRDVLAQRVDVRVEGEGFDALLQFNIGALKRYLSLDDTDRMIIKAAIEPKKVSNIIRETGLPRSTVYRRVKSLATLKILGIEGGKVYVADESLRRLLGFTWG